MHPDLERCRDGLRQVIDGLPADEADVSHDGKWSIARTLEHLDLTYTRSAAGLERRIHKGALPQRPRTLRQRAARWLIVGLGYFPPGRQAPESVVPQGRPYSEVAAGLEAHLVELDRRLSDAERAFGAQQTILDHPIIGPFSVADWRRFHWVHTRHHLRQLRARRR